jgi:hypothetical protein
MHKEKNQKSFLNNLVKEIFEKMDQGYTIDTAIRVKKPEPEKSEKESNKKLSSIDLNNLLQ